jgi:hypothetical protein
LYYVQSELVKDGVNGLTFTHRNASSLAQSILRAIQQPDKLDNLGQCGYLHSDDGQVPSIESHVDQLIDLYSTLANTQVEEPVNLQPKPIESLPAPRRITFDTNPDDCNFSCIMCEQHSEYSPHQKARKEAKIRRRRMNFDIMKQVIAEAAPLGLQEIVRKCRVKNSMYTYVSRFHRQWVNHSCIETQKVVHLKISSNYVEIIKLN